MSHPRKQCLSILRAGFLLLVLVLPHSVMASEGAGDTSALPMWAQLVLAAVLVALSALFAGLTIGIMGLDTLSLEIIASAGSEPDRSYAQVLLPVRKLGHQALCTLVLGNMWANVMIAEFCADIAPEGGSGGLIGFILSTVIILIFAEILPMTLCKSSNALKIAASGVPILKVFIVLLWPIAKPLGMLLDSLIQHDVGQVYDRQELKRLMVVHCETHGDKSGLQKSELAMMLGAMEFHEGVVSDVMTPINEVFMLSEGDILTDQLLATIWQKGYSRIPVHRNGSRQSITGILYAKDLILVTNERAPPTVAAFIKKTQRRSICSVSGRMKLPVMLNHLQAGRAHLYLVCDGSGETDNNRNCIVPAAGSGEGEGGDTLITVPAECGGEGGGAVASDEIHPSATPNGEVVGIITLEDIVEKLIRDEIYDEDDSSAKIPRVALSSFEVGRPLTESQYWACARYLRDSVDSFVHWPIDQLKTCLVKSATVVDLYPTALLKLGADEYSSPNRVNPDLPAMAASAAPNPSLDNTVLYKAGVPTDTFTLILCGTVDVIAGGAERFRSQYRRFSWLGERALHSKVYAPTFTAVVRAPAKVLRLKTSAFELASALIDQTIKARVPPPATTPKNHHQ